MSLYESGIYWLRQSVAWSNSRASWHERLILILFLVAALGLVWLSAVVPLWQAVFAWAAYFVAMAICTRQGSLQLFGPVLFYDMVRTARQSRYVVMRLLYASLLLSIMLVMYLTAMADRHNDRDSTLFAMIGLLFLLLTLAVLFTLTTILTSRRALLLLYGFLSLVAVGLVLGILYWNSKLEVAQDDAARASALFAQSFFLMYMVVQVIVVVLLTPAYVAGAIAEEKDRKTLEFMLATDLNNHEIVLSKLLSRLGNMALFLMTGLPILSILQFVGGVDTELMLSGFAGTGVTVFGIGCVGILFSTLFQKPRDAIGLTYLTIITYGSLATFGAWLVDGSLAMRNESLWYGVTSLTYGDVESVVNAGNPIAAMIHIAIAMERATLAVDLPVLLRNYACFHGVVSLVCIVWSIVRVRAIALKQTASGTTKRVGWFESRRPAIGELPMLWKELHIEGRLRLNWVAWGVVIVLVVLTLGTGVAVLCAYVWALLFRVGGWQELPEVMNTWFRIAGTGVACLMLLMLAVRASTCITGERERDTFDALLTTPMSCEAILAGKLLGCLTSLRMGWLWFGTMLAIALMTRGLHLLAVPIVIGSWFVYAVFFTMVGMWFSMACQSSLRATVLAVLTTLFLGGGHWLLMGLCCLIPSMIFMRYGNPEDFVRYIAQFELGMTPPFVLQYFSYSWQGLGQRVGPDSVDVQMFYFSLVGVFLWALACVFLWHGVLVPKFRELSRREELIYQ